MKVHFGRLLLLTVFFWGNSGFIRLLDGKQKPQIFLIGDSTCANKNTYDAPETGWGQLFPEFLIDAIEVQNHAVNGRSTKSFRTLGHWKKVQEQLKKGDYVLIQFGHNDQKESDTTRFAAAQTDYRKNLIRYIEETESKGAIPILLTPIIRRKFDENGHFVDQHGDYPTVVRQIAQEKQISLIDMHQLSQKAIENAGVDGSKKIFMHYPAGVFPKFPKGIEDNTHFSPYGAKLMASLVAQALVSLSHPLKSFLKKTEFQDKYEFELPLIYQPYFRKDTFNIVKYGAKPDGMTLNTQAINLAIEQCNASGGGTVLIPKGLWLTGPIVLKSNVNLHLEHNALLQFSKNYNDYPIVQTTWEGQESYRCQAPIWGVNLENIGITGEGTIDGGGDVWRAIKKEKQTAGQWLNLVKSGGILDEKEQNWYPSQKSLKGFLTPNAGRILNGVHPSPEELESYKDFLRPNMLSLTRCKNVLIDGISFQNSPAWTMHPLLCEHISIKNVQVKNPWYAQNSDAVDFESCRNGLLENCTFDTGDDGITIKSGRDEQGRKRGVPTENFIIKNCRVYHAHGGFVIGSEMSGGVRNMFVSDCSFMGSDVGLRFKTTRGRGGIVENIYVNNINMTDIPGEAILFDMYYSAKDPVRADGGEMELPLIKAEALNEGTPQFKNFYIQNVSCKGAETAILIRGLPEKPINNIHIQDVTIEAKKGIICIEAEQIMLKNINIFNQEKIVTQIQNSRNVTIDHLETRQEKDILVKIMGENNEKIRLLNSPNTRAKKVVELGKGVSSKVFSEK